MGLSTVSEWLVQNSNRAYPLTTNSALFQPGLDLRSAILDARIVYHTTQPPSSVQLTAIARDGSNGYTLTVSGQNSFNGTVATFPAYLYNSTGSVITVGSELANVPANTTITLTNVLFEPSVCIDLSGYMQGVDALLANETSLTGAVTLKEGYQVGLVTNGTTVTMEVGRNVGLPLPCNNFFSTQVVQDCDSVISFINGASPVTSGGVVTIQAGDHVQVFTDQDLHRVYIGFVFNSNDAAAAALIAPIAPL